MKTSWRTRTAAVLARLLRGERLEREMDDELCFHLEMEERDLVRAGHAPEEAHRLARLRFGSVDGYKEASRDARGGSLLDEVHADLRYALRRVRRQPTFSAAVVLTLGVGCGAMAAVYAVVDTVLMRPLPYPAPEGLVRLQSSWEGEAAGALSPAEYLDYRRGGHEVLAELGAYARGSVTVGLADGAERVSGGYVSSELFATFRVQPLAGRVFTTGEDVAGEDVVVLSEGFWRRHVGARRNAHGETLLLGGVPHRVVGVMPAGFRLPEDLSEGTRSELFLPLGIDPGRTYERGSHYLQAVARLRAGVSPERAARTIEAVAARFVADMPDEYEADMRFRATALPLGASLVATVRPAMLMAAVAVGLVLLVAAVNVATLLLLRGEDRRGELTLRAVLGASRRRLLRQLALESLVLGGLGCGVALALAWLAVGALRRLQPSGIPHLEALSIDGRVMAAGALVAVATALLAALIPALRATAQRGDREQRVAGGRVAGGGDRRLRQVLVVVELAFALALVTSAALVGRSLSRLLAVDTGLRIERVISSEVTVPSGLYAEAEAVRDFVSALEQRLAALPQLEAAGAVTNLPLVESIGDLGVAIPGRELPGDGNLEVDWQAVTPGYAEAIGLRLLQGRWIEPADRQETVGAVVINRTFASRYWPNGDALGATVGLSAGASPGEARIVGVVEDVKHEGPGSSATLQIYVPHRQFLLWHGNGPARALALVVRARPGAEGAAAAVRRAVHELDSRIGLGPFVELEQGYRDALSQPRLLAAVFGAFAGVAALLAVVGVYGVMAYSVAQRRREIGIRRALGARGGDVTRQVLAEVLGLAGWGLGLGVAVALLHALSLKAALFGVSPLDPPSLLLAAGGLLLAALAAGCVPLLRALRVHPAEALRSE